MTLKSNYFSYIHLYLNYAKYIYFIELKAIHYQQKHAARFMFNKKEFNYSRPLLRSLSALNVCQINLYQHLNFMY